MECWVVDPLIELRSVSTCCSASGVPYKASCHWLQLGLLQIAKPRSLPQEVHLVGEALSFHGALHLKVVRLVVPLCNLIAHHEANIECQN